MPCCSVEQPFKSTTPTCDCLLGSLVCTIESGQRVCLCVYGTENAVPFLDDTLYSVFYTKTDYDVSCLAMEYNGIKDVCECVL